MASTRPGGPGAERADPEAATVDGPPPGLAYVADFLSVDEEASLRSVLDALDFVPVVMRGQAARRTVRHFGFDYGYESWELVPTDALPASLLPLRDRCAALAQVAAEELAQTLVSRYPPGAGIGWHRDAPLFGAPVIGVSLLSPCRMRFQRRAGGERRLYELVLEPRSAYVLAGAARWAWQHSIPAAKSLRYSVTFRTLKRGVPGDERSRPA